MHNYVQRFQNFADTEITLTESVGQVAKKRMVGPSNSREDERERERELCHP
jgi:hypothetical protein